jgi:hypothetical protein
MDDHLTHSLENLFGQKIMLYHDLLDCFNKEKESLITIDVDNLWSISKKKEEICLAIKSAQEKIISAISSDLNGEKFTYDQALKLLFKKDSGRFQKLYRTIVELKEEIEYSRKQNVTLIDDSLQFLDEMMSVITGEAKSGILYNQKSHISQSGANLLLNREV